MQAPQAIKRALVPFRPAGRTVRFRLTLLYGALFLAGGAGLIAITYVLVEHFSRAAAVIRVGPGSGSRHIYHGSGPIPARVNKVLTPSQLHHLRQLREQATVQRAADLHHLLVGSGIALGVMAVLAIVVGWLVAGRVLLPLRTMTTATQQISSQNLHDRLALTGPRDELRALADTIDGLVGRLQHAFESQRHFVANAAHELRTPLTLERTLLDVALAKPNPSVDSLRAACEKAVTAIEGHEHLIESLLTLATSERGLERTEPVDLSVIADTLLLSPHLDIESNDLEVAATIRSAPTTGDPRLVERLISNLVDNAIRYNRQHGRIHVATGATAAGAFVTVSNTGPVIPPEEIDRLLKPFQRLRTSGAGPNESAGLGLSIVAAIAASHGAHLTVRPEPEGGLYVEVSFPPSGYDATTLLRESRVARAAPARPGDHAGVEVTAAP